MPTGRVSSQGILTPASSSLQLHQPMPTSSSYFDSEFSSQYYDSAYLQGYDYPQYPAMSQQQQQRTYHPHYTSCSDYVTMPCNMQERMKSHQVYYNNLPYTLEETLNNLPFDETFPPDLQNVYANQSGKNIFLLSSLSFFLTALSHFFCLYCFFLSPLFPLSLSISLLISFFLSPGVGCHFNFFLGSKIFLYFLMPPDY